MKAQKHTQIYLSEDELRPPHESCLICGKAAYRRELKIQKAPDIWFASCQNCGVTSADRLPTQSVLDRYYAGYYQTDDDAQNNDVQITLQALEKLSSWIAKRCLNQPLGAKIDILDFGGGDGALSIAVARKIRETRSCKIKIILVEPSEVALPSLSDGISIVRYKNLEACENLEADIVIASAVLEHLADPGFILTQLLNKVKVHGIFYARTPYHLYLAKALNRFGYKFDFGYPAHLHDMGDIFWKSLLMVLDIPNEFQVVHSAPSVTASTWRSNFFRTLIAYTLKFPRYILGNRYKFVGGWEVFITRSEN